MRKGTGPQRSSLQPHCPSLSLSTHAQTPNMHARAATRMKRTLEHSQGWNGISETRMEYVASSPSRESSPSILHWTKRCEQKNKTGVKGTNTCTNVGRKVPKQTCPQRENTRTKNVASQGENRTETSTTFKMRLQQRRHALPYQDDLRTIVLIARPPPIRLTLILSCTIASQLAIRLFLDQSQRKIKTGLAGVEHHGVPTVSMGTNVRRTRTK